EKQIKELIAFKRNTNSSMTDEEKLADSVLSKKELIKLNPDNSKGLFNTFAEILRRNTISDKTNAFNKIFNLFLCKIVDEDTARERDELRFQWKNGDDYKTFLGRLNDLYKEGVKDYLEIEIADHSEQEIDALLKTGLKEDQTKIREIFEELRLYRNNEFAFKEVYNRETFEKNAYIVKQVVELIQRYQIRYNTKQQFLGDFFENLLNTGIKQEAGQFFTPTPLASFIIKSLPIMEIINKKNNDKNDDVIPYVLDYASGSGHFLTESMDEINNHIQNIMPGFLKCGRKGEQAFDSLKGNYRWAQEYVYGIEKDYRLAKTTKISTLLNGDGEANVLCDDGLNDFNNYNPIYKKLYSNKNQKDNPNFDIVVANPPYSIENFKSTLSSNSEKSFELWNYFGDKPKEIECLFVERAKQVLVEGGVAGIILPNSILSNKGIYERTREFLLKYFEIIAIVELGTKTFMKTQTKTIIVFLKRRDNEFHTRILGYVEKSFVDKKDYAINGINEPIDAYLTENYEIGFKDFLTLMNGSPNSVIWDLEIFREYKEFFHERIEKIITNSKIYRDLKDKEKEKFLTDELCKFVVAEERKKIYVYLLSKNQTLALVKMPEEIEEQKRFLGYEFSERMGDEGIKLHKDSNFVITSSLYDEQKLDNPTKVNYYIKSAFNGKTPVVDKTLSDYVRYEKLTNLFDFETIEFNKQFNSKPKIKWEKVWAVKSGISLEKMRFLCDFGKGQSITQKAVKTGEVPVIAGGKTIAYYNDVSNTIGNVITVSASGANSGYVWYHPNSIFASDCLTIRSKEEKELKTKYIYCVLRYVQGFLYGLQKGNAQPHVYKTDMKKVKIPIVQMKIQEKIIEEVEKIENDSGRTADYLDLELKKIVERYLL
ncbi:N-6 DNA methylase, partial [Candidatus Micrarchaeota archaeon]|nr:N-6 DNA methylase [Candidatus Micrarchaeota archaeon]